MVLKLELSTSKHTVVLLMNNLPLNSKPVYRFPFKGRQTSKQALISPLKKYIKFFPFSNLVLYIVNLPQQTKPPI